MTDKVNDVLGSFLLEKSFSGAMLYSANGKYQNIKIPCCKNRFIIYTTTDHADAKAAHVLFVPNVLFEYKLKVNAISFEILFYKQ